MVPEPDHTARICIYDWVGRMFHHCPAEPADIKIWRKHPSCLLQAHRASLVIGLVEWAIHLHRPTGIWEFNSRSIMATPVRGHAPGLFFFSSRRRHTRLQGDWSSDVCS